MAARTETPTEAARRVALERERMDAALLNVIRYWGYLEQQYCLILEACLLPTTFAMAMAIYFAPSSTETRFAIVDSAVQAVLWGHKKERGILAVWGRFKNRVNRQKNVRNMVAHGEIITYPLGGRAQVRLAHSQLDTVRRFRARKERQAEGMSVSDVEHHAKAIEQRIQEAQRFSMFIHHLRTGGRGPSPNMSRAIKRARRPPSPPAPAPSE